MLDPAEPSTDENEMRIQPPPLDEWPEWAQWFAVDADGGSYFYEDETKPLDDAPTWYCPASRVHMHRKYPPPPYWKDTLVGRDEMAS